jgi:glycosyltransferase involved in cell wall biosynthesis
MRPDVSVIIPTYNRKNYLRKAIASCFEGNDGFDIEVIVVDDGSTDDTQEWAEALSDERVVYVRQEEGGAQVARNRGMNEATGEFIKFLDDDDELVRGTLKEEVSALKDTGASLSCGYLQVEENGDSFVYEQNPAPDLISGIFKGSVWTHPHVFLYRAEALEDCQWTPTVPYHQDTEFAIQVTTQGLPEIVVDCPVALYRRHNESSISNNVKSTAPVPERVELKVRLIEQGIERLKRRDSFTDHHREAATEGLWLWAHLIAPLDFSLFNEIYEKIQALSPEFTPDRQSEVARGLDRLLGVRTMERISTPYRRAKRFLTAN